MTPKRTRIGGLSRRFSNPPLAIESIIPKNAVPSSGSAITVMSGDRRMASKTGVAMGEIALLSP